MSKIDEIARKHLIVCDYSGTPNTIDGFYEYFENAMVEYAEWYATKCLEIAAEQASADFECIDAVLGAENVVPYVEKASITKIKFPNHG